MARHQLTKIHLKNDPDQTLKPRNRKPNRPKEEEPNKPKEKRIKLHEKNSLHKPEYGLKGCTNLRNQQLVTVLSKTKALLMKKDILHELSKTQLKVIAKEHIKMNSEKA